MRDFRFAKGQALGNDYIVVDGAALDRPFTPDLARLLCDRHLGVGGDGVLVAELSGPEPALRIVNPDGGEAEKSGNGLRIFAAWLHRSGLVGSEPFTVRLPAEPVEMQVQSERPDGAVDVRADMGPARFTGRAVGYEPDQGEVLGVDLDLGGGASARIHTVSMGNPHCVVFVDELERGDFESRAPRLAMHPAFNNGTNVQFARPSGVATLEAWIWERGVGETQASGSSACAVAAAATRLGLVEAPSLTIDMPGGSVQVEVDEGFRMTLRGPAAIVFEGTFLGAGLR